jgi:cell division septum initiation protein DivIVA
MGLAFEDETGLPVTVAPQDARGQQTAAPLPLHIEPDVHPSPGGGAVRILHVQPEPDVQTESAASRETEIGTIMVQLQKFADDSAEEAERKAQAIEANAHAQATEIIRQAGETAGDANAIVQAAHAEAQAIVEQARRQAGEIASRIRPPISPETVHALSTAIEKFAHTNRTLVAELTQLRQSLAESYTAGLEFQTPSAVQGPPPMDPCSP